MQTAAVNDAYGCRKSSGKQGGSVSSAVIGWACTQVGLYSSVIKPLTENSRTQAEVYLLSLEQTFSEFCWVLRRLSQFEGDSVKDSIS